ncbi:NapC/NirT family cytochrome c [Aestuariirhabdus litorea]|uniref:Cytochrome c-type protein n=1 Tax=Aestuariirhabdus litorea TaxID=2528527 RepID=A0A3P3VQ85_9GAMM|nr:NapC/NirT family cytochrome c [Aestuariirhabdus litorea]RRJ83816.1 cytochrome C [Aestuariirhabdus litorea]RWW97039.1 cytochrome C [Endozoicomonadaceae bacterium GTF-13]
MNADEHKPTRWQRLWSWLKTPLLLGIPIGVVLLVAGAASFQGVMVLSNQNAFCFSCHLKMDTIVQEYQASSHYGDGVDIPATCADCHVPHPFIDKMKVKIVATADIYHMLAGTVTKENFESLRPAMAESVWKQMEADNSANCRHCHQGDNFNLAAQPQRARLNHQQMDERGETCIDCHQGLTHNRITSR